MLLDGWVTTTDRFVGLSQVQELWRCQANIVTAKLSRVKHFWGYKIYKNIVATN